MMRASLAIALFALTLLPGCGRGDNTPGQPSADERAKLDNMARRLEAEQGTFDTSPDSMVPADAGAVQNNSVAGTANAQTLLANEANSATPR